MKRRSRGVAVSILLALAALGTLVCTRRPEVVEPVSGPALPVVSTLAQDATHKEEPRLLPAEAYVRSYLQWFGGLAPIEVQRRARGADGALLFDAWGDYLAALGLPDYATDLPRGGQTNAIMLGAFERLGSALCARALEHDWKGERKVPVQDRLIFAFERGPEAPSVDEMAPGFDVLHRTFLGYPARLAPKERIGRFHKLFEETRARHAAAEAKRGAVTGAPKSRLSPSEAGWVAVCEGLVRHPELHFY